MASPEERPSKIRRLDLSTSDDITQTESVTLLSEDAAAYNSPIDRVGDTISEKSDAEVPIEKDELSLTGTQVGDNEEPKPLSKSQLKKLRKRQEWEAGRDWRKAKRKEKDREKKARKAENKASTMQNSAPKPHNLPSQQEEKGHSRATLVPITLVLDCGFDELMTEKELISLGSQITRAYSDNRGAPFKSHLVISSWGGNLKTRFETVLTNHHLGWKGVRFTEQDFVAAAEEAHGIMYSKEGGSLRGAFTESTSHDLPLSTSPDNQESGLDGLSDDTHPQTNQSGEDSKSNSNEIARPDPSQSSGVAEQAQQNQDVTEDSAAKSSEVGPPNTSLQKKRNKDAQVASIPEQPKEPSVVYLTSDSPHTLDRLSPYTTYIIGGIVDKNRHKGLCYKRACERNIPTAKLPIGEFMVMQSRAILATNHVVEIMLKWLEDGNWGNAFLRVIPKRKEARLKGKGKTESMDENLDEEEEEEVVL